MSEFSFVVMMEVMLCLEDPHNLHPMILCTPSIHISAPFQELLFLPLSMGSTQLMSTLDGANEACVELQQGA